MSKAGGWVPLDKNLVKTLPHDRPYSIVEAVFSHTVDLDCGRNWSVNGYAQMWGWSRNKVRKLVSELRTGRGHEADRRGTGKGHAIHYIDKGLWDEEDTKRTGRGQEEDRKRDTTINPIILNPKENKKDMRFRASEFLLNAGAEKQLVTDWLKVRKEKRLANTETAFSLFLKEVTASGLEINFVLTTCCQRSWGGFKAEWLQKDTGKIKEKPTRLTGRQAYMVEVGNMLEAMEDLKNGIDAGTGSGITGGACLALPGGGTHRGDA